MNLSCAYLGYTYRPGRSPQLAVIATILLVLSIPTTIINGAMCLAIFIRKELKTPSYFIIANLAFMDCLSGCTAYIFYAAVCIMFALGNDACTVAAIGTPLSYVLGCTTYNTIAWQSIERHTAVFFPFWYHERFSLKAALIGNVLTWVFPCVLVTFLLVTENSKLFHAILGSVSVLLFCVNIFVHLKVFREVRRIEKDIANQQVSREERRKVKSNSKVAKTTTLILLSVVTCYAPLLLHQFYSVFYDASTQFLDDSLYWVWMLALVNSSINPLVTCSQLSFLRKVVIQYVRCSKVRNVIPLTSSVAPSTKKSRADINLKDLKDRECSAGRDEENDAAN